MPHTPGPYKAFGGAVKAISHGVWFTVALVDKARFTPEGRAGNAILLAAAPELLESLKWAMHHVENVFALTNPEDPEFPELLKARNIIKKAEGIL